MIDCSREKREYWSYLGLALRFFEDVRCRNLYDALESGSKECKDSRKGLYLSLNNPEVSGISSTNIVCAENRDTGQTQKERP